VRQRKLQQLRIELVIKDKINSQSEHYLQFMNNTGWSYSEVATGCAWSSGLDTKRLKHSKNKLVLLKLLEFFNLKVTQQDEYRNI
jgi:hypothetical protein